jgi:NitT/TauT family transport system substrate-binding protein
MKGVILLLDISPLLQLAARIVRVLAGMSILAFMVPSCRSGYEVGLETLTLGLPSLEQNALIYVADVQGFFAENGLDVSIKDYDSGVTAIQGLLEGEADLAEAAEFPVVRGLLQKEPISVIVSNDKFENDYLIGRKDRGLEEAADLKGKRIGVTLQTINEFYLGRFLELKGINLREVTLVDLKPAQFVDAIANGEVDALIAWQPYIQKIIDRQPDIVVWPAQNNQAVFGLLVCRDEWLSGHGDTVERFLKALERAETYLLTHPDKARAIVQERLGYDSAYIASVWPQHHFFLSLDYSLVVAMSDEAHWMISNGLTTETVVPDFLDSIYTNGLDSVNPQAVNINR